MYVRPARASDLVQRRILARKCIIARKRTRARLSPPTAISMSWLNFSTKQKSPCPLSALNVTYTSSCMYILRKHQGACRQGYNRLWDMLSKTEHAKIKVWPYMLSITQSLFTRPKLNFLLKSQFHLQEGHRDCLAWLVLAKQKN